MLMIKAVKRRDVRKDKNATDQNRMVTTIRHPFSTMGGFALQPDINENTSLSIPVYMGKQNASFLANANI